MKKSHLLIGLVAIAATFFQLAGPSVAQASVSHKLKWVLAGGSQNWDANARNNIIYSMNHAVAAFNVLRWDKTVTANYSPGTPTADGNFSGWINFGGEINISTAEHEIAHCLGTGTYWKWQQFVVNGRWTGRYANAQLKAFDGSGAVLFCDRAHFWPYGLNYATEWNSTTEYRHTLMVKALCKDMGISTQ